MQHLSVARDEESNPFLPRAFASYLRSLEEGFPSMVQLFVVHYICNSKCRYCPVGRLNAGDVKTREENVSSKRILMPWHLFEKVAREVGEHPETILRFHGRGEPTMHPKLADMVGFAKRIGIEHVTTFTNGILMNHDFAEELLGAGIDLIEFSIDASTQKTYQLVRRVSKFEAVCSNVLETIKLRNEMKKDTKIIVSAVDHSEFASEKTKFKSFWGQYADQVIIRRRTTFNDRVFYSDWKKPKSENLFPCSQPWTRFNVSPSGNVIFCANDWGDEFSAGNLNDPTCTIESIWRSERYRDFRQAHLSPHGIRYCINCTENDEARWKNNYEKIIISLKEMM